MMRHADGNDQNLLKPVDCNDEACERRLHMDRAAGDGTPARIRFHFEPDDCGRRFNDVDRMTIHPHHHV